MVNYKFNIIVISLFMIFSNAKLLSVEVTDSVASENKQYSNLTVFVSAGLITTSGMNATTGIILDFQNKYIPISSFIEVDLSFPIYFNTLKGKNQFFSCINSGLWFKSKLSENWFLGISIGSGMALLNGQYGVNSTLREIITYRSVSFLLTFQSIVSEKFNTTNMGVGLGYTF